jgi:ribosome-binding protein aMBF1 (putative translation factor)
MERCVRCQLNGEEVRLYDSIYEGRINKICERCSIIENVPIIKKPDTRQLKESEKAVGVYDRMKRLAGIRDKRGDETFFRADKLKTLIQNPELEMPEKAQLNLIEHFHWEIMKNRRRKGLSHKQLAEAIEESEVAIQMIEKAKLPENAESLIRKLEQFFQIGLRRISEMERVIRERSKKPVLLDESGNELKMIPEKMVIPKSSVNNTVTKPQNLINSLVREAVSLDNSATTPAKQENRSRENEEFLMEESEEGDEEIINVEVPLKEIEKFRKPVRDFDIKKIDPKSVSISQLRDLHRRKIEATRQEKIEEQKRIEERQRLIEARKEELRLLKEKESKELDSVLGGVELFGKKSASSDDRRKDFDDRLV